MAFYATWLAVYLLHQVLLLLANLDELIPKLTPLVSISVLVLLELQEVRLDIKRKDGHISQGVKRYFRELRFESMYVSLECVANVQMLPASWCLFLCSAGRRGSNSA